MKSTYFRKHFVWRRGGGNRFALLRMLILGVGVLFFHVSELNAEDDTGARKVALVIGNSNYLDEPLSNTEMDAIEIADSLSASGFEILSGDVLLDKNKHTIERNVLALKHQLENVDTAVIYFAGHGIQKDNKNYLLPVNARLSDKDNAEKLMVSLDWILAQMRPGINARKIIILDASHEGGGLAEILLHEYEGVSIIVASSAAANATVPGEISGINSRYANYLSISLRNGGMTFEEVLKFVSNWVEVESLDANEEEVQSPTVYYSADARAAVLSASQFQPTLGEDAENDAIELRLASNSNRVESEHPAVNIAYQLIQSFYKFHANAYLDRHTNTVLIGFGRRGEKNGARTDRSSEESLLRNSLEEIYDEIAPVTSGLSKNQRASIISFVYDAGLSKWPRSKMYKSLTRKGRLPDKSFRHVAEAFIKDARLLIDADEDLFGVFLQGLSGLAQDVKGVFVGSNDVPQGYHRIVEALLYYMDRPSSVADVIGIRIIRRYATYHREAKSTEDGYWVIGYGSRYATNIKNRKIEWHEAEERLVNDYFEKLSFIERNVKGDLGNFQRAALASFIHDVGEKAFIESEIDDLIARGEIARAAESLRNWTSDLGEPRGRSLREDSRRHYESRMLFLNGPPPELVEF